MAKASAKEPFLPMFVGDFMAATNEWEGEEQALYALLLMHQWAIGDLPADLAKLAKLVRWEADHFERYWPTVSGKFIHRGKRLVNRRLEEHREKSKQLGEIRANQGRSGGIKSGETRRKKAEAKASNLLEANGKQTGSNSLGFAEAKSKHPSHPIPSHPDPSGSTHTPSARETWLACRAEYPAGLWEGPKEILAERAIGRLLDEGELHAVLVAAARSYREQQAALGKVGTEFILGPQKFYGEGHWRGPFKLPQASSPKITVPTMDELRAKYGGEVASG